MATKEKYTKQLNIRLTPSQYEVLKKSAEAYDISTYKYAQKLIAETKLVHPPKANRISKKNFQIFMKEYMAQGRNLNQMAKTLNEMNQKGMIDKESLNRASEQLILKQKDLRKEIWQLLVTSPTEKA